MKDIYGLKKALMIIQEEECEALKVFKQNYSSSEASSSESESECISHVDSVDSYLSDGSSLNIVPDTLQKTIENSSSGPHTRKTM